MNAKDRELLVRIDERVMELHEDIQAIKAGLSGHSERLRELETSKSVIVNSVRWIKIIGGTVIPAIYGAISYVVYFLIERR
jgi:hypothetical protein